MGKKRRLLSAQGKFANKHSAHPRLKAANEATQEMELTEAPTPKIGEVVAPIPVPEPKSVPEPVVEKAEVAPKVQPTPSTPKKKPTRRRSTTSRARTSRKTKAKTEASA